MRIAVKPAKSDYHEKLAYEFDDRETDQTKAILRRAWGTCPRCQMS